MKPRGGGGRELSAWVRKGPWTAEEDEVLRRHVMENGPREWSSIRSKGLLPRTGKSCRLRWVNKLRPDIKKGCKFSAEEERVVIELQAQFGNKWARIATYLSGRTDNDVKNFWSTRQKRLARLLRAPAARRRPGAGGSGRQSCGGASSSHARASPAQKLQLLCQSPFQDMDMIPFQETKPSLIHTRGQSGSGRQSCGGVSSSRARESPAQLLLCQSPFQDMDMIPFQETKPPLIHTGGQSSIRQDAQEPLRPRTVPLTITLPKHYDSTSELGSSSATPTAAATRLLSFGDDDDNTRSPPSGVDPLVFVDPFDDDAFSPEPLEAVPPIPFFGLDVEEYVHFRPAMQMGVRFDDLTPETLDFFGLPPSAQP